MRYRDDSLHQAARDITLAARSMGYELGPVEEFRPCPVCGAEPGALCIRTPGHDIVNGAHPERSQDEST
ncbi:zinc finger domain-containing protein [Micromonospora sp. NPDC003776]